MNKKNVHIAGLPLQRKTGFGKESNSTSAMLVEHSSGLADTCLMKIYGICI